MAERLNILPSPSLLAHRAELAEDLERIGSCLRPDQFADLVDPLVRESLLSGFAEACADEGTVWLLDETGENLVPAFNTGPDSARFVGQFKQPLGAGLIPMVFASERPFLENEVWRNERQSKLLDSLLQVQTCAMIAVPLYLVRRCRGVLSCVQLRRPGQARAEPPGFRREHLASVQRLSALLTRLIDMNLLSRTVGWGSE